MMSIEKPKRTPETAGAIQWMPSYEVKAKMKSERGMTTQPIIIM
jgi:hypothetical protein